VAHHIRSSVVPWSVTACYACLGVILHISQAACTTSILLIIQIIQSCYRIEILALFHTSGSTHCLAGCYKNAPPPSPNKVLFFLLTTSTLIFCSNTHDRSSHLTHQQLFSIFATNFHPESTNKQTCLLKAPPKRSLALAARPLLVAKLLLRRRRPARRLPPLRQEKRRSEARPGRRPTLHTSTKVLES
jgi:hypothetical protein